MEFVEKTAVNGLMLLLAFAISAVVVMALGGWVYNRIQDRRLELVVNNLNAAIAKKKSANLY